MSPESRFVTEDTVEEKIIDKAMKKLFLDAIVIKQGRLQVRLCAHLAYIL